MKIIDLLNKIANGEEVPENIKYDGIVWTIDYAIGDYYAQTTKEWLCEKYTIKRSMRGFINDTVEIIEEDKKIEKLDVVLLGQCDNWTRKYNRKISKFDNTKIEINPYIIDNIRENTINFQNKINELIDEINKLKEKIND